MSSTSSGPGPVTVVVATHEESNWAGLSAALRSLDKLADGPSRVVVAVDHNPVLADRIRHEFAEATVVGNDGAHRGASATRNAGAAAATTPFIAFLDDDEVAEDGWLTALLAPFDDPAVVGTGGRYIPVWDGARPSWFPDELAWVVGGHHSGMPSEQAPVRNVWSGNMAVRAELFHLVDGFREAFGKSGSRSRPEDTDLCIRMAHAVSGGRWIYVPDARILHTVPARRSGFGFYLRRCFAEGAGKIDMRDALPEIDALDIERDYLRRTIPHGVAGYLGAAAKAVVRGRVGLAFTQLQCATAVVLGVLSAACGATASVASSRRRSPANVGQ